MEADPTWPSWIRDNGTSDCDNGKSCHLQQAETVVVSMVPRGRLGAHNPPKAWLLSSPFRGLHKAVERVRWTERSKRLLTEKRRVARIRRDIFLSSVFLS